MSKATTTDDNLPRTDVEWGDEQEILGMTVRPNASYFSPDNGRGHLSVNQAAYIVDGIDDYLAEHDTEEIDVPPYYSRFQDEFGCHVVRPTIESSGVAYGITSSLLEGAVRLATGGGRFRSDDLRVYETDQMNFLVEYDGEWYVFSLTSIRSYPDDYEPDTWNVHGYEVPEGNEAYRDALDRVLTAVDEIAEYDVTGYKATYKGKHTFHTDDEKKLYVRSNDLRKVAGTATSMDDVQREYTIETEYGEEYTVEWSNVEYEIGDTYDDWYHDDEGIVLGMKVLWEDPRTSARVSMTGKITVDGTYTVMKPRGRDKSYHELTVKREKERLGEFDPENEEWTPL